MTDKVDDLDARRKAKAPRCAICGHEQHEFIGQCSRIIAITEEEDGGTTYWLTEPDVAG